MIFLLDTNIISELRKPKPHGAVLSWYSAHPPSAFALPAIALFELEVGAQLTRQNNPLKFSELDRWMDSIVAETIILPLDATAAREAARLLHKQSPDLLADAMVAAIAKVHRLTVATRNTKHFGHFDVPFTNPFGFRRL